LADFSNPNLKPTTTGPKRMKDVRVCHVSSDPSNASLLVLGRPQVTSNHGTISAAVMDGVYSLAPDTIEAASIIDEAIFCQDLNMELGKIRKGAANDAVMTSDGNFLIFGHSAWVTGAPKYTGRHYEAVVCVYDHQAGEITPPITLARRDDFGVVRAKNDILDLNDVVFPGGFCCNEAGQVAPFNFDDQKESHLVTFGLSDGGWAVGILNCRRGLFLF
jgi:hypothetical protein